MMTVECSECGRPLTAIVTPVGFAKGTLTLRVEVDAFSRKLHAVCLGRGPDGGGEPLRIDGVLAA